MSYIIIIFIKNQYVHIQLYVKSCVQGLFSFIFFFFFFICEEGRKTIITEQFEIRSVMNIHLNYHKEIKKNDEN